MARRKSIKKVEPVIEEAVPVIKETPVLKHWEPKGLRHDLKRVPTEDEWRLNEDTINLEAKKDYLSHYWLNTPQQKGLDRETLYSSSLTIQKRDWKNILFSPEDMTPERLSEIFHEYQADGNRPWGPSVPAGLSEVRQAKGDRPVMCCEYGFGHTTFLILDWCLKNNGYLVTVEMPIAHKEALESPKMLESYLWGVDRYTTKYPWCLKLQSEMKKRWLWVNDDIFEVSERIADNKEYREKLFLDGKIDFFMDDAIHEMAYAKYLHGRLSHCLSEVSYFYAGHNHHRWQ